MSQPALFSDIQVGPYRLKNRVVMAPMTRNRAGAGNVPTPLIATYYRQRATAGLIITEATQIMPEGQGYPSTPGIHSREQVEGWKLVTEAIHKAGGRIFLQLWHVGRISHSSYQPNRVLPVSSSAKAAPGKVFTKDGKMEAFETPRALDSVEVPKIVDQYRTAAKNALDAGFDGVEVHGANGYLIDQFLQTGTNDRADLWGGPVENRARLLIEATRAAIDVWGANRVGVRLSPNGTFNSMSDENPEETFTYAVRELDRLAISYLHIRTGTANDVKHGRLPIPVSTFRALFRGALMLNDGFNQAKAEAALVAREADLIAFGTPYISNPDLVERYRTGAPLNDPDSRTFYGGGEKGYSDYPSLADIPAR